MKVNDVKNMRKMNYYKTSVKIATFWFIIIIAALFLNGCARFPNDPNGGNGGNGTAKTRIIIKVEINQEGTINSQDGIYYVVFNTDQDALFAPDDELDNWEIGYQYIKLEDNTFYLGEVTQTGLTEEFIVGTLTDNYFQVTMDLEDLGEPDEFLINAITTNEDNVTYDSMDLSLDSSIDTTVVPSTETIEDYLGDSEGGVNFDLERVTVTFFIP